MLYQLNQSQIQQLAGIASDTGLVALASVVLPAILNKFDWLIAIIGAFLTIICWAVSIWLLRGGDKK